MPYARNIYIRNLWTWLHFNSNYLWYSSLIWCLLSMPELTESANRIKTKIQIQGRINLIKSMQAALLNLNFQFWIYIFRDWDVFIHVRGCLHYLTIGLVIKTTLNWGCLKVPGSQGQQVGYGYHIILIEAWLWRSMLLDSQNLT